MTKYTAHLDTFVADNLPPSELWPQLILDHPDYQYSERLNCATELLDKMVANGFAQQILFHTEQSWSYLKFLKLTNQIATYLVQDLGVKPGNRVLLRGPNSPWMAACWFAVLKAGGVCVTSMPLLRSAELNYMVEKAQIKVCLCDQRFAEEIELTRKLNPKLSQIVYFGSGGTESLEHRSASKAESFDNVQTSADDPAIIAFTSGTTGKAKATVHFHRDLMVICDAFPKHVLKASSTDIFCGSPPFAFTFGLGGILLFPMRIGAGIALVEKPSPEDLLKAVAQRGVSVMFTSPTMYRAMLPELAKFNTQTLRLCVSAGETLPLPTFHAWHEATGLKIIDGIGATELLHIFISASDDQIHPGSTGKVVPGYEARILDQNGAEVADGEVGLLAVRGPTGCRYLADSERQKEYVRFGGWNMTGDAYHRDSAGYYFFHSRADDMIISSGYNISGIEVENVLLSHPDVKECGVVGVSDPDRGQIVKAFVVLKSVVSDPSQQARDLQDFVKAQIAPYKYPRAIEFVSALPRTESGKLQRFRLRAS